MQKSFNKKDFVLAMFILLFTVGLTGCGPNYYDNDAEMYRSYKGHENVVVRNDNQKIKEDGYRKSTYLYVRDLKDNKIRRVEYFSDCYSLAKSGDTVTLYVPRFYKLYKAKYYKPSESNLREAVIIKDCWGCIIGRCGQTYITDSYGMIESHVRDYFVQKEQEERAIKARLDSIKCARNRATDSLRIEFADMSDADRIHAEKTILNSDNEILKQALGIVRAEERDEFVADSMEKAEHDRILEQQRQIREAERQKNRTIVQCKRNGTLWQYIDSVNVTIKDTVTVVRVYKEMQLKGDLKGTYNSSSYTQPIEGVGPRGIFKFGEGRGHISGGGGQSNAKGSLNGNIDYSGHGAVVARDKYGYQYTFPTDPMMQVKAGDKIVLDYYGRIHTNNGYIDNVKILNVKYR